MGEYATFTKWRKLKEETEHNQTIYHTLLSFLKGGNQDKVNEYLTSVGINPMEFGSVQFREIKNQMYYAHIPMDFRKVEDEQQVCKYNLLDEWLLCFTFDEMSVIQEDSMGYFCAETSIKEAMERINSLEMEDTNWKSKRYELLSWLGFNTNPEDRIIVSSDLIYYSPDGEFDATYVKKDINEKVKRVKEALTIPYWKKCA